MILNKFVPKMYKKNIHDINYDLLKKQGVKLILFDLDNTLTPAREEKYYKKNKELFDKLKKDFKVAIFSNNFKNRVSKYGEYYDVDLEYLSLKPLCFKYMKIKKKYGLKSNEIATIGDQLLTDVFGANNMKMYSILITPVSKIDLRETWLNRKIEGQIFKRLDKKNILKKGKYYE